MTKTRPGARAGLPLVGPLLAALASADGRPFLAILAALVLWGIAIMLWGLPGLFVPAVVLTPVVFLLLLAISRG